MQYRQNREQMIARIRNVLERVGTDEDTDSDMNDSVERRPSAIPRMGRRFTLNPLIFAKEERDLRRQSLAQLKLSYYPKNAHRKPIHSYINFPCHHHLRSMSFACFCCAEYTVLVYNDHKI